MGSKKKSRNTIELKKEIIQSYKSGFKLTKMSHMYVKSSFMISYILAKKGSNRLVYIAKYIIVLIKQRLQKIEDFEQFY